MTLFSVRAPSNIALIKYMGKKDVVSNLPENGSISMTLDSLCTIVDLERGFERDRWIPELPVAARDFGSGETPKVPVLDDKAQAKIARHIARVKSALPDILPRHGLEADPVALGQGWTLRSANTFPHSSGIASSASAFAAITLVSARAGARDLGAFDKAWAQSSGLREAFSRLARQGSGSSCRSLDGPWVGWGVGGNLEEVRTLTSGLPQLAHFVIVVSEAEKPVSSSEAHSRVKSSPLWAGRVARVEKRLIDLQAALAIGSLRSVSRIAWTECWEMHSLFHTAEQPFTYWEPTTIKALKALAPFVERDGVPPIVTLDAGPNIHVSVPAADAPLWKDRLNGLMEGRAIRILSDRQGTGATPL